MLAILVFGLRWVAKRAVRELDLVSRAMSESANSVSERWYTPTRQWLGGVGIVGAHVKLARRANRRPLARGALLKSLYGVGAAEHQEGGPNSALVMCLQYLTAPFAIRSLFRVFCRSRGRTSPPSSNGPSTTSAACSCGPETCSTTTSTCTNRRCWPCACRTSSSCAHGACDTRCWCGLNGAQTALVARVLFAESAPMAFTTLH